jgi:GNAT superfamily N-acetyltransferase
VAVQVEQAATAADWAEVGRLVRAYLDELPFAIDFQDLDRELAELADEYGPPTGAALLVRPAGSGPAEAAAGVVGVRRFGPAGSGDAELKRMYVAPEARGTGAGRILAVAAVDAARALGYQRLLLDTVASMAPAIALYESLGFEPIGPYRHNPLPDARYFALALR